MNKEPFLILLALGTAMQAATASAQEIDLGKYSDFTPFQEQWLINEPAEPTSDWLVSYGGRLYDKWFALIERSAPTETHPSYPKESKQKGPETWRCKACHGWDYLGKDGAYGNPENSNYTGIKGIRDWVGKNPRDVIKILRDDTHKLDQRTLPKFAAERLALFVTQGQNDTPAVIDANNKFKGDAKAGKPVYQNLCAVCHGYDGKAQNFGSPTEAKYLGTVAQSNPWELLHKMTNGHPGAIMPSQRWVSMDILANIAAYTQTLAAK